MKAIRWRLVWLALSLSALLSGCGADDSLAGFGKSLEDVFNSIKLPSF